MLNEIMHKLNEYLYGRSYKKCRLYYYSNEPNFGDVLSKNIISALIDLPLEFETVQKCNFMAIGSILEHTQQKKRRKLKNLKKWFLPRILVWGSGFIKSERDRYCFSRLLDVRAVRGYITLKRLQNQKNVRLAENVAIGDPGLLAARVFDTAKVKKKYKLGIIPHYVDKENPLLAKINVDNAIVLDVAEPPEKLIYKIAECECIIASAMHGLIVADSLGVPNVRMIMSDKIVGGDYKYDDYYSAFGIANHRRIDLRNTTFDECDVETVIRQYPITKEMVWQRQEDLLRTFPFLLKKR